ncbi:creatininase family protein [Peribacillus deserti]|uniref:Creatininase n=1 Tax=Peribacillus deserti TaxID=673318 RepID=A0A2N5M4I0_9BACI|nr:creatininase family protein [Peribacillus deserti]PLT29269.1 creatininase [Peribacillus deserti]
MLSFKNSTKTIRESGTDIAMISVGATEQFGPYLPMHLDTLIAEEYAEAFGNALGAYVLPTIPFNTSEEHASFKGTVTISPSILTAMLEEVIVNLKRQGFNKFVLCNGHGGAYWESSFVKHINFKYQDLILITTHRHLAWEEALREAGIEGLKEKHGGFLSVCTALWLCPELVKIENMGSEVPVEHNKFADYVSWDKLTKDGCWGKFEVSDYSSEQLAKIGKTFWTTFIAKRSERLKENLERAFDLKMS